MYEKGDFYKKHLDQFKNNDRRKFSFITYLNQNWTAADGGELLIHHQHAQQHISPKNGKSVFFKSNELPHEVLVTNKSRMSITGWLAAKLLLASDVASLLPSTKCIDPLAPTSFKQAEVNNPTPPYKSKIFSPS